MGRACSTNGAKRNAYRILGKPERKRPPGRPRRLGIIKLQLREIGCGSMGCIDLLQDRNQWRASVNMVMKLQVP
jgi:hypothetical protein